EGGLQLTNVAVRGLEPDAPAELLQHVDPAPPIGCIYHEVHRAVRLEYAAQGAEPRIGVAKVMQHAGADNLIKACRKISRLLERQLVDLKIVEFVLALQFLGMSYARGAEIDAGDL